MLKYKNWRRSAKTEVFRSEEAKAQVGPQRHWRIRICCPFMTEYKKQAADVVFTPDLSKQRQETEPLVPQIFQKCSAIFGTQKFIAVITSTHSLHLSLTTRIQSTSTHLLCLRSILILSIYAQLLDVFSFSSDFPPKTCMRFSAPHVCYMPRQSHFFGLDHSIFSAKGKSCTYYRLSQAQMSLFIRKFYFFPQYDRTDKIIIPYILILTSADVKREDKGRVLTDFQHAFLDFNLPLISNSRNCGVSFYVSQKLQK